jgi:ribosomal protein S14
VDRPTTKRDLILEMSNQIIRDHKRRLQVAKFELKRLQYKALAQDRRSLSADLRYYYSVRLSRLPKNSSKTRIRNRCVITGRGRAVYKMFRISRIVFRELASRGAIIGIKKASW